jgi:hypothetical protein
MRRVSGDHETDPVVGISDARNRPVATSKIDVSSAMRVPSGDHAGSAVQQKGRCRRSVSFPLAASMTRRSSPGPDERRTTTIRLYTDELERDAAARWAVGDVPA